MKLYREFTAQEQIDEQYDIEAVLDMESYGEWIAQLSASARRELDCSIGVPYGPTRDEFVDIFPSAEPNSPVLVFIHGGWWRSMSSRDFHLVARGLVARGVTVVISNYSLCPRVSISEITRQNRAVIAWVYRNIKQYLGDPDAIFVAGHSAGGHQVAMLSITDWEGEYGLPQDVIRGGVPISGLFDLRPFLYSWLQPKILLSHQIIERESPVHQVGGLPYYPPLLITLGGDESEEFHRQSRAFGAAWAAAGGKHSELHQPGKDHITAITDFAQAKSRLTDAVMVFIETHRI